MLFMNGLYFSLKIEYLSKSKGKVISYSRIAWTISDLLIIKRKDLDVFHRHLTMYATLLDCKQNTALNKSYT